MRKIVDSLKLLDASLEDIVKALGEKEVTAPSDLKLSQTSTYIDKVGE